MKKNSLSKSTFIRGLQCHKSLYLHKKRSFLRDRLSPEQFARFKRGTNVGVLARDLFPGGYDASPPTHFQTGRAVETTRELVAKKQPVIYEAYFSYNSVVVALDILEHKNGKWYGYEVKSSLAISDTYLNDAALQYHVISNCGIEPEDFSIIYMNKDYVLQGNLDLNQLFVTLSVLEEARLRQSMIAEEIEAQLKVVGLPKSPAIDIGLHCNKPYPCDFQGHCWKHIPKNSIFDLQWLSEEQKFELTSKKIFQVEDIPDDFLSDPVQKMKLQAHKTSTPFIDKESLRGYIENIEYPVCFLKVWYHRPAVPLYEGTRPYERLPFFMSTGIKAAPNQQMAVNHYYFDKELNPLSGFGQMILQILKSCNSIIVYNDLIEKFMTGFSDISAGAGSRTYIHDLHSVFIENHYYNAIVKDQSDLSETASSLSEVPYPLKSVFRNDVEAITALMEAWNDPILSERFKAKMELTSQQHLQSMDKILNLFTITIKDSDI